ncbi:MAG: bacillithiol biosynthesis cysteine-adding enzyme BshC [Acidobacteriaceae bacterium]
MTVLPHVSVLFREYVSSCGDDGRNAREKLRNFYSPFHCDGEWMQHPPLMDETARREIAALLRNQNRGFGAGSATEANIARLAEGAAAVVTGQQVTLFGGPLLTLLKAATAIRVAADASRAGHPHVPIFWLATEDHDFDEVNQAIFPAADDGSPIAALETLRLPANPAPGRPVGNLLFGDAVAPLVDQMRRCLGQNSISELLASLYTPGATFASAFAGFLARIFSEHGLIVIDASSRPFHAFARNTLGGAIERADEIHAALLERDKELERAGFAPQVLVSESSSLLFLLDETTGVRMPLKKTPQRPWSAGARQYSTAELSSILEAAPERISPSALLRPIMQDTLLPSSAYVGGPAEIAYFAQSQVAYAHVLNRTTPILPRFSATLIDPTLADLLHQHGLTLPDVFTTSDALAQRLGARAMPIEGKRKLAAAGNALDVELKAVTEWMHAQDKGLGHAADVAASKMLYQMNRLRRLSAAFGLQKDESLRRHADALCNGLFPQGNLQERVVAGAWFLAKSGPSLIDALVEQARSGACGHHALFL